MSHRPDAAASRRRSPGRRTLNAALVIAAIAAATLLLRDETGATAAERTVYGPEVALGQGTARTYVIVQGSAPTEVGVALSERSLSGLPAAAAGGSPHEMMHEYLLQLPAEAGATVFKFVELDWNPMGHEPDGIYTVPHFDFHFYTIPVEERNMIDPGRDPQYAARAGDLPAAEFAPPGYLPGSALAKAPAEAVAVPRMGMHWLDPRSEELNGQPFRRTFIYGSWAGKLIFAEPMITKAYLETRPDFSAPLAVPQRSADTGLRATSQRIYWNAATSEYRVALGGLSAPTG